mgnify:CR=1 FL=1
MRFEGNGSEPDDVIGGWVEQVRERIEALRTLEFTLVDLVQRCASRGRKVQCPLIAALMQA